MRLLIVVDKLLTGFDAPPCTYLYIDKSMQDHGLFQAIIAPTGLTARIRSSGTSSITRIYSKGAGCDVSLHFRTGRQRGGGASPEVLLQDRLKAGRERFEERVKQLRALASRCSCRRACWSTYISFYGNIEIPEDLQERAPRRVALYKGTAALMKTYANIANDLQEAGYSNTGDCSSQTRGERHTQATRHHSAGELKKPLT